MSNDPIQMAIEVWRPVPHYESNYEISDFGNLRNIKTGRLIRPTYTVATRRVSEIIAKDAYAMADAMLAEREKARE